MIEATPEILRTVHEEIVRITRLVEELDRLARVGEAPSAPLREPVDLVAVVRRTAVIYAPDLDARGIALRLSLTDGLPPVSGDPDALGQVLTNLLQNAAR